MCFSAMNLLLLLSALLSALSGVGGSTRGPGVAQAVAGANVASPRIAPSRETSTRRPAMALPPRVAIVTIGVAPASPDVRAMPHWADRRRE